MTKNYKELLKDITTFVFDVDGVFTDSSILITTKGELLRKMSVRDGYAVKTALIGAAHKEESLREYLMDYDLRPEEVLYMGDDIPDIPAMQMSGIIACPQNAVAEVKRIAHYISHLAGGEGCVREIIEQVLKVRGHWHTHFNAAND